VQHGNRALWQESSAATVRGGNSALRDSAGPGTAPEREQRPEPGRTAPGARHVSWPQVSPRKITDRGLVSPDTRLSDEVVVRLLIEHGIVTAADLGKLNDPAWCSRQEDLWWSRDG
jgi:hypothetical protein